MPDMMEQMYCSQQIQIPPSYPYILKQYAKAAIRTQPYDLLEWSAAYFRALADGEEPPVKVRLEYPPVETASGLTPGYLKVLIKQLGENEFIPDELLIEKWKAISLNRDALEEMLCIGKFQDTVNFMKFVGIAAGYLTHSLTQTMILLCELLTEEPDGGSAMIPVTMFCDLYRYLARLNCGPAGDRDDESISEQSSEEQEEEEDEEKISSVSQDMRGILFDIATKAEHESLTEPMDQENLEKFKERHSDTYVQIESILESIILPARTIEEEMMSIIDEILQNIGKGEVSKHDIQLVLKDITSRMNKKNVETDTNTIFRPCECAEDNAKKILEDIIADIPKTKHRKCPAKVIQISGIGPQVPKAQIESVINYMNYWSERQEGMVMPRNIRHFLCPPLDICPYPDLQ